MVPLTVQHFAVFARVCAQFKAAEEAVKAAEAAEAAAVLEAERKARGEAAKASVSCQLTAPRIRERSMLSCPFC